MKAAIKDLGKFFGAEFAKTNYLTSFIPEDANFGDVIKIATQVTPLKSFLQLSPKILENYQLIANQPRTISVHAAGVIITPNTYKGKPMTIFDWIPVKKHEGVLVTEWEGPQLDIAGFLKMDILGITQLQKFSEIIKLIKQNHGTDISFKDMDLEDPEVYDLFQNGLNEDVFQFGAAGLKNYCRDLKPSSIEDLIATVALYRPGPIESGAHKDYIKIKHGLQHPEYDYMLEDVTKVTHGQYIYQEQIMKAVNILGGMSKIEADDVRRAMSKSDFDKMEKFKVKFIKGAIKNKCPELEAINIWNRLERFGNYGFNRSHAAAYAHIGYFSQWLKHNFPIEFWSVSLRHSKQDEMGRRIAEMHKISDVKVLPPDINNSIDVFKPDFEKQLIFWSIKSISYMGETAMKVLLEEREKNGNFFSFEDFHHRVEKRVNKRAKLNLILSGCFDIIEKIKLPIDRITLVKKFMDILSEDLPEEFLDSSLISKEYFWILKQKELTGFGYFDFEKIYKANASIIKNIQYLDPTSLQNDEYLNKPGCVVGIVSEVIERRSKKGPWAQVLLNHNDEIITCLIWSEIWEGVKEIILRSQNKIILLTGEVRLDSYRKINVMQTTGRTKIEIL